MRAKSCFHRLAVAGTALLLLTGSAAFLAGVLLLVHPACPDSVGAGNGTSSRRSLFEEPALPLGFGPNHAVTLALAPTSTALAAAALAAVSVRRQAPPEASAGGRAPFAAAMAATDSGRSEHRRLSCAPTECSELDAVADAIAAVHATWVAEGDVAIDELLSALELWYPLLDVGGSSSVVQGVSWAEFVKTAAGVTSVLDGYYASDAVPAGRPPRSQALLKHTLLDLKAADGSVSAMVLLPDQTLAVATAGTAGEDPLSHTSLCPERK